MVEDQKASPNNAGITLSKNSFGIKMSFALSIFLVILSSLCMGVFSLQVIAHPFPISYKPHPNEIINFTPTIPHEVVIMFTDRPEIKASSLKVIDSVNGRVDNNDLKLVSDKILSVSLNNSKLHIGNYTVYWLVFSKDDGYSTKGSYEFSIVKY
ncbi:MAG: copper resistance protein CopC [Candidatus Nitrosocosmicus sp.]|nr:copper resistance protein CopC [Candidatus Nitrosocosmicus sp.]